MSFLDLAAKAHEEEPGKQVTERWRKLRGQFEETFGIKPAELDVGERTATIEIYTFALWQTYEKGIEWMLTIKCSSCLQTCDCGRVSSLANVGAKIKAWERDHKCTVTTTGEA